MESSAQESPSVVVRKKSNKNWEMDETINDADSFTTEMDEENENARESESEENSQSSEEVLVEEKEENKKKYEPVQDQTNEILAFRDIEAASKHMSDNNYVRRGFATTIKRGERLNFTCSRFQNCKRTGKF